MAKRSTDKVFGVPASIVGIAVCLLAVLIFGFSSAGATGTAGVGADTEGVTTEAEASTDGAGSASDGEASSETDSAASGTDAEADSDTESGDDAAVQSDDATSGTDADSTVSTDSDSYGDDIDPVVIYPRVLVDGVWKYAGKDGNIYDSKTDEGFEAITVTKQASRAGGDRAIIPASLLESALAKFGFSASSEIARADQDYTTGSVDWGNYLFGYCDSDTETIYNDVTPQLVTGDDGTSSWYVFTKGRQWIHQDTGDKSLDVFYLPANRDDGAFDKPSSYFAGDGNSRAKTNTQVIADNSFYSVTVEDFDHRIYGEGEDLPSGYINANVSASKRTFTIKKPTGDAYRWQVVAADGCTASVESVRDNGDGTLTYTFANVTGPVTFAAVAYDANKFDIVYQAEMQNNDRTSLGNIAVDEQVITENTTIGDDDAGTLTISVDATGQDSCTLLAPNSDIATVYWTKRTTRRFIYTFMGWKIVGDESGTVYSAGDEVPSEALKQLAGFTGSVTFKSVWSANDTNTSSPHIRSVNFYLNLDCEILDVDGSSSSSGTAAYTESIYATRVSGTDTFGAGGFTLLSSESSTSAYAVDKQIRNATSTGTGIKPPSSWTDYTQDGVTFERFPTDEEVLQKVRELGSEIKIDDEVISRENLTTSNFTVRWYVVKYDETDGWHIDGVLVAKKARLVVSKTFEGETDALEEFTAKHGYTSLAEYDESTGFRIDVTHETEIDGTTTAVGDYQLLLVPDSELDHSDTTDRRYGYTSYDADTNTYTWEIDSRQGRLYTVKESNYYLSPDDWNNLTWYEVHNSNSIYNTNGWTEYNIETGASVKVLAAAYPTDVPSSAWQTIGFRNAYVHKGTLAVYKNDHTTGAAMANVAFEVTQTGTGAASVLYRKTGTNQYTTDTAVVTEHEGEYEKVEDNKALTDSTGVFFLSLAAPDETSDVTATYQLKEDKSAALGYEGPDTITFTMSYNSGIAAGDFAWEPQDAEVTWAEVGDNRFILNIYNRSVVFTSVTAKKQWVDEASAKPVTVQLWRKYGDVDELVPSVGAGGVSTLVDADGNACSNTVQLSSDNSWAFSWGNLPLFINNQSVTYHLRETWIGDPASSDSVAYDVEADPEDGYADYAVTTEDARYASGAMPDAGAYSGDELRGLYPHDSSSWEADGSTTYASHVLLMVNNADVRGVISFTKKDRAGLEGKPLAGAVFMLYSDAACTKEIETQTSGADGLVAFSKQSAGTYYFKEILAPTGYSYDAGCVYRAVVSNGTPTITVVGDASQTPVTSVYNKFGAGLNVRKIGSGDAADAANGVSGAEFTLTKVDGTGDWAEPQVRTTAANGVLSFTGLDHGAYVLTESKEPAGYEAVGDVSTTFVVETDDTGKTTFTFVDADFDADTEAGFVTYADDSTDSNVSYTVTVRNKVLYDLPVTGGVGIAAITAAGATLMCAAVYLHFRRKRN